MTVHGLRTGGLWLCGICCLSLTAVGSEMVAVPFDSEDWTVEGGRVVDHLDRTALAGGATLSGVAFTNGTIEVDLAVTGATSYPGIDVRIQGNGDGESIYLRPHRIERYGDGVQYGPKFNNVSCWQLYNGDGFTAGVDLPRGEWVTVRFEILGDRARVFLGDLERPILAIDDLKRELRSGAIGVRGPADGSAFFSNFRYTLDPPAGFGPPPWRDSPPGIINRWEVSEPLTRADVAARTLPETTVIEALTWRPVEAEPSGLINLSRYVARTGPMPDAVLVRTAINVEEATERPLDFGYSDHASVYLNGRLLFTGRSAYRERDPSFLGIIGYNDTVVLPLAKGHNELVVKVTEVFGGWGLMARWGDAVDLGDGVASVWSTGPDFRIPESVAWDPSREVFYVSNYDGYNPSRGEALQSISRISADGSRVEVDWITGLRNPVGLVVAGDTLWAAESSGLAEIDLATASVARRYPLPQPGMPNDPTVDGDGTVYLSDPRGGRIYRLAGDALEVWLEGDEVRQPNGIHVMDGELLIGVNGDQSVKAANLETRELRTVARLGPGIIDGIGNDGDGNIIVSHWEGRVFRIAPDGTITKLIDTTVIEELSADIEFVPERGLLAVPTFFGGRVTVYRVGGEPPGE